MLYALFKDLALALMKAPTKSPDPPAGSEGEVQVFRASRNYLTYRLLVFWFIISLNWLVPWAILIAWLFEPDEPYVIILAVLYALVLLMIQICVYFAIRIDYDMRYYIVTDRSLRIREGAFIVKEKTISFANVQNLRVTQGPIMRLFRIWHLNVDTAGGGSAQGEHGERVPHRVKMAGIENAPEVRDLIRSRMRQFATSTGLGDLDDHDDDRVTPARSGQELVEALRSLREATAGLRKAIVDQ